MVVFIPDTERSHDAKFPDNVECCTSLIVATIWLILDECFGRMVVALTKVSGQLPIQKV